MKITLVKKWKNLINFRVPFRVNTAHISCSYTHPAAEAHSSDRVTKLRHPIQQIFFGVSATHLTIVFVRLRLIIDCFHYGHIGVSQKRGISLFQGTPTWRL